MDVDEPGHDWLFVFSDTHASPAFAFSKFQWLPELKRWRA